MRLIPPDAMEASLTNAISRRIIREIVPRFRAGDYAGGVETAMNDILAVTRGAYRGTGDTAHERRDRRRN